MDTLQNQGEQSEYQGHTNTINNGMVILQEFFTYPQERLEPLAQNSTTLCHDRGEVPTPIWHIVT